MKENLLDFCKKSFSPSEDQCRALEKLHEFFSSDSKVFILKGYAGTGKTTITKLLAEYCLYLDMKPILMAPTGRASRILSDKTKQKATTIHKAIYDMQVLDEKEIKKDGKVQYKFHYNLKEKENNDIQVFFVDEASMISDKYSEDDFFIFGSGFLLRDIIKHVAPENKTRKDKLIFIGDKGQLPPVTDNLSAALDGEYLFDKYQVSSMEYELTEVVRQSGGSGILRNATKIRKLLQKNEIKQFFFEEENKDVEEIQEVNMLDVLNEINPTFSTFESIILTGSNKNAHGHNTTIRNRFWGGGHNIKNGETLLIYQNNYNYEVDLLNGTLVKVVEASDGTETKSNMPSYDAEGSECKVNLRFRWITIETEDENNKPVHVKCMILDNFLFSPQKQLDYAENIALYIDFKIRYPELKPKTDAFKKAFKSDPYVNALRVKFGYALTVHKAQGGEWKKSIIDLDFYQSYTSEYFLRWLYTALTRASEKTYFFNYKFSFYSKLRYIHSSVVENKTSTTENRITLKLSEENKLFLKNKLQGEPEFILDKYHVIIAQLQGSSIKIIDRKKSNWCEEYTFESDGTQAILLFYYNGKNQFTSIFEKKPMPENKILLEKLMPRLETSVTFVLSEAIEKSSVPVKTIVNEMVFPEELIVLKKLYDDLAEHLSPKGIIISSVDHNKYVEKYRFIKGSEKAMVQFWYDGNFQFTTAMPHIPECNSNDLLGEIAKIITELN